MANLVCRFCTKQFVRRQRCYGNRFCSSRCVSDWTQSQHSEQATCLRCQKPIWKWKSQIGNVKHERKYCSKQCMDLFRRSLRPWFECSKCGKQFQRSPSLKGKAKYCSAICTGTAKQNLERSCLHCQRDFHITLFTQPTAKFCSFTCKVVHEGIARRKEITPHRRLQRAAWRKISRAVIERDGGKCTRCGDDKYLAAHHVIPWRLTHDDSMENLITLCGSCHFHVEWAGRELPLAVRRSLNGR